MGQSRSGDNSTSFAVITNYRLSEGIPRERIP